MRAGVQAIVVLLERPHRGVISRHGGPAIPCMVETGLCQRKPPAIARGTLRLPGDARRRSELWQGDHLLAGSSLPDADRRVVPKPNVSVFLVHAL